MSATATLAREVVRGGRGGQRSTPDALRVLLAALVLLSLAWGVVAALTADQHASAAADVVAVSEPLSLDAEQIYQSLSDADATAANAFLAGGLEPAAALQRYNQDTVAAGVRIEAASALVGASAARTALPGHLSAQTEKAATSTGDDLATLSAGLPVYASEVSTAQADNRLGLPLGAAYLREADGRLRGQLLTAASGIYTNENALLTSASAQATGLPLMIVALLLGIASCVVLVRASRWLSRHTHRVMNTGLVAALVVAIISLGWLAGAYAIGRSDLLHAQQYGSAPAESFARADVAALRAHTDESLTLIDNTGDDSYQQDFLAQEEQLRTLLAAARSAPGSASARAATAVADAQAWYRAHQALRALDNGGSYQKAVSSAENGASAAAFGKLSADLNNGITSSQSVFASSARGGRDAFTGLAIGMIVAALLMTGACVWGLNRRLAEYR